MLVKVPLLGDDRFYMMLQQQAVWAALPHENSILLHLVSPLDWPVHPDKIIGGALGPTELLTTLHQIKLGEHQGSILPCRMPLPDICRIFTLVPFSAAGADRDLPIGIHPGFIFSYAPSFAKDGTPVGTNIYTSRPFAKVGSPKIHVRETPEEVTQRLGIKADDLIDVSATLAIPPTAPAPETTQ